MDTYGIEDLMPACEATFTNNNNTMNNNTKELNFIEKRKLDNFLNSGKVEGIEKAMDKAEDIKIVLATISNKFDNMVRMLDDDNYMLGDAIDNANLIAIEKIATDLEAKLEIVDEKEFSDAVSVLAKLLGATVSIVNEVDKEAVAKGMGFVAK